MNETKSTTNQVRQVLMNELGLSRDSVRAMMVEIITEAVNRKLGDDAAIDAAIERAITQRLYTYQRTTLLSLIEQSVRNEVYRAVKAGLKGAEIRVPLSAPSPTEGT